MTKTGELYWQLETDVIENIIPEWMLEMIAEEIKEGTMWGFIQFEYEDEEEE